MNAEELGKALDVAWQQPRSGYFATIRTLAAIDSVVKIFTDPAKTLFNKVMALHVFAKRFVFRAILFTQAADLHEIREH